MAGKQMKCLDVTCSTPAANLALDEALLDAAEVDNGLEVLRFWAPEEYFVVVGYANAVGTEANVKVCRKDSVPVLRRCSGGGTVLQGLGCLNYTVILQMDGNTALKTITGTNQYIMGRQKEALSAVLGVPVQIQGHTDLAVNGLKFSGNAQRRKKNALIFHGTFLLDFDLPMVEKYLAMPSKQPDYRQNRGHREFLMNLKKPASIVKTTLQKVWSANEVLKKVPDFQKLVSERYATEEWNLKF